MNLTQNKTGFRIPDPPAAGDITRCVHCGLCLNHCPTYRLTGLETESPRGRLFLIRQLAEGKQEANAQFIEHIGLCLGCQNCETVCPSGVRFGHLFEAARAEIVVRGRVGQMERAARWLIFKKIWPHPARLNALVALLALYQRSGLRKLLRGLGILKWFGRLSEMEALLPARRLRGFNPHPWPLSRRERGGRKSSRASLGSSAIRLPPRDDLRGVRAAALFTGCIMRAGFGDIHDATIRVLEHNGWHVAVPDEQICCAALHVHAGEREIAKDMARKNIDAFLPPSPSQGEGRGEGKSYDAIVVNAAGCGAMLKNYGELLHGDGAYAERAKQFSVRVKDVSELLAQSAIEKPTRALNLRVTFQEPCHLAHAQRIKKQPREILNQIAGIEFVEMLASDRCCGSAGIYNLLHPEIANQLIDEKMANIAATKADVVVTGNIGCLLQLEYGKTRSQWKGRIAHLVELLDEAYK